MATAALELTKEHKTLLKSIKKSAEATPDGKTIVDDGDGPRALYEAGEIDVELVEGDPTKLRVWLKKRSSDPVESSTSEVAIESDWPLRDVVRGGKKAEQYPFSKMNLGDSFLIPVTDKHPKPWISFASTVTTASRRFSKESETEFETNRKGNKVAKRIYERKFTLRRVTKGDTYPNGKVEPQTGARVYRIL